MIEIYNDDQFICKVEKKYFPCGELLVQLPEEDFPDDNGVLEIRFTFEDNDDLLLLLLVNNALRDIHAADSPIHLRVGYFPYGRQDRIANLGEPHSLKVVCQMINSCGFAQVTVLDPHSDVIGALIENVVIVDIADIFEVHDVMNRVDVGALVSPDAGAYKKVGKVAKQFGLPVIRADKVRDTRTGQITDIEVYADDLTGQRVMIVDDIADGGGTFIGLAQKLKEKGAERVLLYTTHGMYTKGVAALLENGIDEVICKNYHGSSSDRSQVTILD